ncbi:hypothetical protein JCM10213_009022 [Rhodosporidiobolus nylandii]
MSAFQQRRQAPRSAPIYSPPSSEHIASPLSPAGEDDAVLLFSPPAPPRPSLADADSSWDVLFSPERGRGRRSASAASTASASTGTGGGGSSVDSPESVQQASLLPAHDGTGAFFPAVESSLVLSGDGDSSSSLASPPLSASSSLPFSSTTRRTRAPSILSRASDVSELGESWGRLTEENLAAAHSGATPMAGGGAVFGSRAFGSVSGTGMGIAETDYMHGSEREEANIGFTSGSEEEEDAGANRLDAGANRLSRAGRHFSRARAAAGDVRSLVSASASDESDWALSPAALSSGLLDPAHARSSSRRRIPASSLSQSSPALSASGRSASSYKRRHRRAGGRAGSQSSQKRSAVGGEQGRREERERQARVKGVIEERERERMESEERRRAEEKMLFGHAVLSYLHIPPSTVSLLASSEPSTAHPTPTPSRSASPSRLHGLSRFAAQSALEAEAGAGGFSHLLQGDDGDVSDAETEHPAEQQGEWARYSRDARVPRKSTSQAEQPPHRSHSTSALSGLGLVLTPPPSSSDGAALASPSAQSVSSIRRSSSFAGVPSLALSSSPPPAFLPSASADLRNLSHAERIMLSPTPSASVANRDRRPVEVEREDPREAQNWGGEFDTLELAMSYWRRLLRRLGVVPEEGEGEEGRMTEGERHDLPVPVIGVYA